MDLEHPHYGEPSPPGKTAAYERSLDWQHKLIPFREPLLMERFKHERDQSQSDESKLSVPVPEDGDKRHHRNEHQVEHDGIVPYNRKLIAIRQRKRMVECERTEHNQGYNGEKPRLMRHKSPAKVHLLEDSEQQ